MSKAYGWLSRAWGIVLETIAGSGRVSVVEKRIPQAIAFTLAVQKNGSPEIWLSDSKSMIDGLAPYLRILKNCGMTTGCFPNAIYKDIRQRNQNIDQVMER